MKTETITKISLLALVLFLGYLSWKVIEPLLSYLIFSVVLVMIFNPIYLWLKKKLGEKERISSLLIVIAILLLLIIPSIWIGYQLIEQAPNAYESFAKSVNVDPLEQLLETITREDIDVNEWISESISRFRNYALKNATGFLSSATNIFIGLFVMFFTMYYLFKRGPELLKLFKKTIPIQKKHQEAVIKEIDLVVHGIIEGQVILGAIQGILGGILFWILGIPNPLFWGFIMMLFSVIPVIGAWIVWVPAGIWLFLTSHPVKGIILAVVGVLIISQVDNFLRPYIVSRKADIHPVIVIIGVFGGLKVFGVIGFITGPLILALFIALLQFYKKEVV